jgi:hypothetical protein
MKTPVIPSGPPQYMRSSEGCHRATGSGARTETRVGGGSDMYGSDVVMHRHDEHRSLSHYAIHTHPTGQF